MTRRMLVWLGFCCFVGAAWQCRGSDRRTPTTMQTAKGPSSPPPVSSHVTNRATPSGKSAEVAVAQAQKESTSGASDASRAPRRAMEERTWSFQDPTFGRIDVVVVLPDRSADERFPLLIALHGRGEAMKGPERGARGWVDDYSLLRAMQRLADPPLVPRDFENIVAPARLDTLNLALGQRPFRGLVVLCPYTPEALAGDKPFDRVKPYVQFLTEVLIPHAYRELPVFGTAESTGIDGVSLGGRVAILSGLFAPERFRAVAGLQAAFDSDHAATLGQLGDAAFAKNPNLVFRWLTSDRDFFLDANQAIALEFERRKLPSRLRVVPGPHDYTFNRGPGAIEMLFFHDRALRYREWPE